jgi:queuosine precursor transporter
VYNCAIDGKYCVMFNECLFVLYASVVAAISFIMLLCGSAGLIAWIAMQAILANLFVLKQIRIFGLYATASDVFSVGYTLSLRLLEKYHGSQQAQVAFKISSILLLVYVLVAYLHLSYIPSFFDTSQIHFAALMSPVLRLVLASFTAYFVSGSLLLRLGKVPFLSNMPLLYIKEIIVAAIVQCVDTVIFTMLGLYGIVEHLLDVIIVSFMVKMIAIIVIVSVRFFCESHR